MSKVHAVVNFQNSGKFYAIDCCADKIKRGVSGRIFVLFSMPAHFSAVRLFSFVSLRYAEIFRHIFRAKDSVFLPNQRIRFPDAVRIALHRSVFQTDSRGKRLGKYHIRKAIRLSFP